VRVRRRARGGPHPLPACRSLCPSAQVHSEGEKGEQTARGGCTKGMQRSTRRDFGEGAPKRGFKTGISREGFPESGFQRGISRKWFPESGFQRVVSREWFPERGFQRREYCWGIPKSEGGSDGCVRGIRAVRGT